MRKLIPLVLVCFLIGCATASTPSATFIPAPATTSVSSSAATPAERITETLTVAPTPTPSPSHPPTLTRTPQPAKIVIVSVDGLRPDGLLRANTPNMMALAKRGAYTWQAQTVFPPVTLPAHASMLSGFTPSGHGITWNDYLPERGVIAVPTLFSLAHDAGLRTVMVIGKEKFAHLNAPGTVDAYVFARNGDQDVANQAVAQVQTGFDLMFVHLPNVDFFGHSTGWMSETYLAQVARTDEAVGRLLAALPGNTTVILSADHGGHGAAHGSDIPEDLTIPWIIAGPNVLSDRQLGSPIRTTDTAATAAYVLGLTLPPEAEGQPVYEAFGKSAPDVLHGLWAEGAVQSPARSEMPAAVIDGLIYVPGGFGGETAFQAYDPAQDVWIDLAPLPAGRHHLMAAALKGRVYVFGGAAAGGWNPTATAFAYDPALNTWTDLAPLPEPRMSGAAVALAGRLYVVGGVGDSSALLEYDPATNTWRSLAALSQPRDHLAAAALDGEIYALGGRWGGTGELSSIEIYSPAEDAWRAGPPLLQPRAGFSAAVLQGHILVAGGEIIITGSQTLMSLEVFDLRTQSWSPGPDLPYPIHGVAAAAAGNRFCLLGGSSQAGAIENFGRVMIYTP